MMFRHLARDLTRRLPEWDASAKIALAIAILLLLLLLAVGFLGPSAIRLPARFGAFGLLVSIQLLLLWGNRRDASPYHQAQQHFIAGEYPAARALLESVPERGRASVDPLVLLGNTYRHLGQFELCRSALSRALELKPGHSLARYSIGKLELALGNYGTASDCFQGAIAAGAPDIVDFDLGQARYLAGDGDAALTNLTQARAALAEEPAQLLLLQYYMHALHAGAWPDQQLIDENLKHWRDEADKYAETPYGRHLSAVVGRLDAEQERAD